MNAPPKLPRRRILVVDDDQENRQFITEALMLEGYDCQAAGSGQEALRHIDEWKPELVLLDYNMPGATGLETLSTLRKRDNYVATIFISANTDHDLVNDCLDSGADDYIRKPFNFGELLARIKVRFRNKDVHDALEKANRRLSELAEMDELTGLFNMRSIYQKIELELKRARRYGSSVACIMMDLDYFKQVNDTYDHLFGSFFIQSIGHLIKKNMREVDFAARYGGDEYLMVLTQATPEGTFFFADRLRQLIGQYVCSEGTSSMSRTASLGFAVSEVGVETSAKELVRKADHALYQAKETGRNKVVCFSEETEQARKVG